MLKKILYTIIIFSISFFIYTTYIKKESSEVFNAANPNWTSTDVRYTNGIYTLKAKEEIQNTDENKWYFKKVEAYFEKSVLKGDNAVRDAADNITLTNNVVAVNPTNGWTIKGQELVYYKDLDRLNSTLPVTAYNKFKKLTIVGNYLESTANLDEIVIQQQVKATTAKFEVISERALYKNGILDLLGSVETEIKSLNKTNAKENSIIGVFPGATYDTKIGILRATGAYQMFYKDFVINATELIFDENKDIVTARGAVTITGKEFYGEFTEAAFNLKEDKVYFVGPIKATLNTLNFTGDNGVYDNGKETFEVKGNAVVIDGENTLTTDRLFYTKKSNLVEVFGGAKKFTYTGTGRTLTGEYAKYFKAKNIIEIPGKFSFNFAANMGEVVDGTGEKLSLNTATQMGEAQKPVLIQGKDNIKANKGTFDFKNGIYKMKGKVVGSYAPYILNAEEVDYHEVGGNVIINNPYTITEKGTKFKISGNKLNFDTIKYIVVATDKTYFENETTNSNGIDLTYNMLTKIGEFKKDVYATAKTNGMQISGNKAQFKTNDYITLSENAIVKDKTFVVKSSNVTYSYIDKKVIMPNNAYINTYDKGLEGNAESGVYDLVTQKYSGNNFNGWNDKATVKSDFIFYDLVKEEAFLNSNILIKDKKDGIEVTGSEIIYYLKTNIVVSKEPLNIKRDNINMDAASGQININDKTVRLDKAVLTTSNRDRISGDTLNANLLKNEFTFDGNIDGILYSSGKTQLDGITEIDYANPIKFKGELTKAFFVENGKNKYIITRNEIINSSEFLYKDMKLTGDYIEVEKSSQKIFTKGNSKVLLTNGNKISADKITMDMLKEITNLKDNVIITNISDSMGGINTKADKAVFRNKDNLIDLEGNIESYKGKTKFQADKGVYDLTNNKLNGKGNIFMSLDFSTAEQTKEKQKKQKDAKAKIDKAIAESMPVAEVDIDGDSVELKKQFEGVNITWSSSNDDFIDGNGNVLHPSYKEKDVMVTLNATYTCDDVVTKKSYKINVRKYTAMAYLRSEMKKDTINVSNKKLIFKNKNSSIKLKLISGDERLIDNSGNIITNDLVKLNGLSIKVQYTLDGLILVKEYRGSYIDNKLNFIPIPF